MEKTDHGKAEGARPLLELARLFLKLGATAFGGPAAHLAMMEAEVVGRRRWMDRAAFLDLVGACNLLPGPNSTEMALHLGHLRAGWPGLLVAGACFILPAALITLGLAWAYGTCGRLPAALGLMGGIKPVVLAVTAQAVWNLGLPALKSSRLVLLGGLVLGLHLLGFQEAALIPGAGAASVLLTRLRGGKGLPALFLAALPGAAAGAVPFSCGGLFWVFLKAGSTLFGSGYVLLAYLRTDLVHRLGWLSEGQLLDAISAGQVTPGPVFTTATFTGYLLGSWRGALAATAGIFLPAFVLVGFSGRLLPRLRAHPGLSAFLDGVNVAAVVLMGTVLLDLGRAAVAGPLSLGLAGLSAILLIRFKVNATWLVLGGGAAGVAGRMLGMA